MTFVASINADAQLISAQDFKSHTVNIGTEEEPIYQQEVTVYQTVGECDSGIARCVGRPLPGVICAVAATSSGS